MTLLNFTLWVFLTALAVNFVRTLMVKWGILEWLQVHITWGLAQKLLHCEFCTCFWLGMILCIPLGIIVHPWLFIVPVFSSTIR